MDGSAVNGHMFVTDATFHEPMFPLKAVAPLNIFAGDVKIEIAENILLKGIEQNVQSTYLQLQYVIFMAAYKGNFEQSKIR